MTEFQLCLRKVLIVALATLCSLLRENDRIDNPSHLLSDDMD
jgi:hypothetical protein